MWRRNPKIIHLYDKPLSVRTPARSRYPAPSSSTIPVLWCSMIIIGTVAFFWVYDLLDHHDVPMVPALSRTSRPVAPKSMRHDEPPSPDMNSPEVLRANADVATEPASPSGIPDRETSDAASMPQRHRGPPKINKVRLKRKHLPPEAAHAYGAAPNYLRSIFGNF